MYQMMQGEISSIPAANGSCLLWLWGFTGHEWQRLNIQVGDVVMVLLVLLQHMEDLQGQDVKQGLTIHSLDELDDIHMTLHVHIHHSESVPAWLYIGKNSSAKEMCMLPPPGDF